MRIFFIWIRISKIFKILQDFSVLANISYKKRRGRQPNIDVTTYKITRLLNYVKWKNTEKYWGASSTKFHKIAFTKASFVLTNEAFVILIPPQQMTIFQSKWNWFKQGQKLIVLFWAVLILNWLNNLII